MKRILLITEGLGSGGAERQLCGLAVFLKEKGYTVKVVTYSDKLFYLDFLKSNKVDYENRPSLLNKFLRPFRLVSLYKEYKPDVIISFLTSVNKATCIAQLFYRKAKLIVSERNTNQSYTIKDKITFSLYNLSNYIVPNSYSQKNFILKHFPSYENKVRTITNFVDLDTFKPAVDYKSKEPNSPLKIVTVARFTTQKNCLRYLKAIAKIKENGIKVRFEWYGNMTFDSIYMKQITDLIKELSIGDYISLKDHTNDVVSVYHNADVFCLPSLYEGYPNVVCEAMSCGLPILCSRVCDNPMIVEEGKNGFMFDPLDVDDICTKIKSISSKDKESLLSMSEASREIALQKFSKSNFINKYLKIINIDNTKNG